MAKQLVETSLTPKQLALLEELFGYIQGEDITRLLPRQKDMVLDYLRFVHQVEDYDEFEDWQEDVQETSWEYSYTAADLDVFLGRIRLHKGTPYTPAG